MHQVLQSSVFGPLQLDDEVSADQVNFPLYPSYATELTIPCHGTVCVTLAALFDEELDWPSFLHAAEESYPVVLQHEAAIRQQAAPQILTAHREYYEGEWHGSAVELVRDLCLANINFFSDGTFELWYSGGKSFHHHDVRIGLDPAMRVSEVGLDG